MKGPCAYNKMPSDRPHGEKEFLRTLGEVLHPDQALAWRDDCVITDLGSGASLVYSMDRPENIFQTADRNQDLRAFGRWSAAIVSNDVIACGASPRSISFDVGLEELPPTDLLIWAQGVLEVCARYGMRYEGGNLAAGRGVSGTAWGLQRSDRVIRRSGARDRSVLIATAAIGTGWAVKIWGESGQPLDRLGGLLHQKQAPFVNLAAFQEVWETGAILAGMDLTDGVIEFAYEIVEQSGLGVCLEPVRQQRWALDFVPEELGLPPEAFFFEPGYDTPFAHGWCVEHGAAERVLAILRSHGVQHTILGTVTSTLDGVYAKGRRGQLSQLPPYWDDKFKIRGSTARWRAEILPLFSP